MIGGLPECDAKNLGCKAIKRDVNNWYVVSKTSNGVHIYEWDKAPVEAMREGKHFCGVAHALNHMSHSIGPDETDRERESTLELKPPLARDGSELESSIDEK